MAVTPANKIVRGADLQTVGSQIKSAIANGVTRMSQSIPFGEVDSTSTAKAFTATVDGITELADGVSCYLKNGVVTSAAASTAPKCWTLNINNLGAKPVYVTTAAATYSTTQFTKNYKMLFTYDSSLNSGGGGWYIGILFNSNTTYSDMSQAEIDAGTGTTGRKITPKMLRNNFYTEDEVDGLLAAKADSADIPTVPTKVSDLTNDAGYISGYTEIDPTVPAWAKAASKPTYTASEVGALPSTTSIPSALSDLSDDSTHRVVTDAEKTTWNGKYTKPSTGIPASDLAAGVIPNTSTFEVASNKVTSLSSSSTDTQYPSAKCVYDMIGDVESALAGKQDVIKSVQVTVDNNTGTPSASGSVNGDALSLNFHNLKGAQGPKGDTGATGPQGPAGVSSVVVNVDNTSGTPSATATVNNGVLTINISGIKGEQGNSGYSGASEELEVVNNLKDGGATKALSAEQGKVLNLLMQVEIEAVKNEDITLNQGYLAAYQTGVNATVTQGATLRYSDPIAVKAGDVVFVESQGTGIACICSTDENGSYYTARAISNDGSKIKTYTYEVDSDGYVAISSRAAVLSGKVMRLVPLKTLLEILNIDFNGVQIKVQEHDEVLNQEVEVYGDLSYLFSEEIGQAYGSVNYPINISTASNYAHVVVSNGSGATHVKFIAVSSSASSYIQYVDDSNKVLAIDGTSLVAGNEYGYALNWPTGATRVFVSGVPGSIKVLSTGGNIDVNAVGDLTRLESERKTSLVDAINEINEAVDETKAYICENVADTYTMERGQHYGSVGAEIQYVAANSYVTTKILREEGVVYVELRSPSNNVSSLIQYVDDDDIILKLDAVAGYYSTTELKAYRLIWPQKATAVYITSTFSGYPRIGIYKPTIVERPQAKVRVMGWNVGMWTKGATGYVIDDYSKHEKSIKSVINELSPDVVCLSEYEAQFNGSDAKQKFFPGMYSIISGQLTIFSCHSLMNASFNTIGLHGVVTLFGRQVIICSVHPGWQGWSMNNIRSLINTLKDYPYVIIAGDFNYPKGQEEEVAQLYDDAGFSHANWGYLGAILTAFNNNAVSNACDDIVVKGGRILRTGTIQFTPEGKDPDDPQLADEALWKAVNASDHFPIFCDILFD